MRLELAVATEVSETPADEVRTPDTNASEVPEGLGPADAVRTPDRVLVGVHAAEAEGLVDELGDVDEDMLVVTVAGPDKGSGRKLAMLKPTYVIFTI